MTCRFEMQIKKTGRFHCAAQFGPNGWAYLWTHAEDFRDPCIGCPIKIEGRPLVVSGEIRSKDFSEIAGKRIRGKDWDEIERRGYRITVKGLVKE
jgi:hypothetical protein